MPPNTTLTVKSIKEKLLALIPLKVKAEILLRTVATLLTLADWSKYKAEEVTKLYNNLTHEPSNVQYLNRFVEFYEGDVLWAAAFQYAKLIDSGVDPEHAFFMITGYPPNGY